jgi:hypothetical protein
MGIWKTIQLMALFMIMLVISLPLCTSFALADTGTISDVSIKGRLGTPDFVSNEDSLEISLNAQITGGDNLPRVVEPTNILFTIGQSQTNLKFSACSQSSGNGYNCSYKGPLQTWESGKYALSIRLYDSTPIRQRLDLFETTLYSDNQNPVFQSLNIPSGANVKPFSVSYTVKDTACDDCIGKCIGIDRVELGINGNYPTFSGSAVPVGAGGGINIYGGGCTKSGTFNVSASTLGLNEGKNEICIKAYDLGGLFAQQCKSVYVDYLPPEFVPSSFFIRNKLGNDITYSSAAGIIADILVNISDSGSGISSENVYANLSLLNPEREAEYDKIYASSCTKNSDGTYLCVWNDIEIKSSGTLEISLFALDDSGNENTLSKNLNLPLDSEKPVITEITTLNGVYLNKANNTIIVKITESGSGMNNKNAYLNLAALQSSYGARKQADSCKNTDGIWECYWYTISVSSSSKLTVKIAELSDDSGLTFKLSGSTISKTFILDSDTPIVNSYNISPLSPDMETIAVGDIISIVANITEKSSEILASNALIDYSAFDANASLTPAQSCTRETNTSIYYICKWEYAGPLTGKKTVSVKMIVKDIAGNSVTKSKSVFIAGKVDKVVDNWDDSAIVAKQPKLNPNFLWQSNSGTAVRAEVSLVPKAGTPFVHAFKISECKGRIINGSANKSNQKNESFSIVSQSYFPGLPRDSKLMVFNIPKYDKTLIQTAIKIEVFCHGEITQAASEKGDIYVPNEKVNMTFEVPLLKGSFFTQPEYSTVNKIHEKRQDIEKIDKVLDLINSITKWLDPICTALNNIRTILNNICTLITGFYTYLNLITGGSASAGNTCPQISSFIEELWYGKKTDDRGLKLIGTDIQISRKNVWSFGFVCDLVVCEECNMVWRKMTASVANIKPNDQGEVVFPFENYIPDSLSKLTPEGVANKNTATGTTGGYNPPSGNEKDGTLTDAEKRLRAARIQMYFDPQRSLLVALICWPPCLKGIQTKLNTYKATIVTYNVCLNTAAIRGQDTSECDTYYSSQVCQQILGEFWYIIDDLIKQFITKSIMYVAESWLLNNPFCPPLAKTSTFFAGQDTKYAFLCIPQILMGVVAWFSVLEDTMNKFEEVKNFEMKDMSEAEAQKLTDAELALTDEQFKQKYGVYPGYGK